MLVVLQPDQIIIDGKPFRPLPYDFRKLLSLENVWLSLIRNAF